MTCAASRLVGLCRYPKWRNNTQKQLSNEWSFSTPSNHFAKPQERICLLVFPFKAEGIQSQASQILHGRGEEAGGQLNHRQAHPLGQGPEVSLVGYLETHASVGHAVDAKQPEGCLEFGVFPVEWIWTWD